MGFRSSSALAIALLVLLAGCTAGLGGTGTAGGGQDGTETGSLAFYLSDRPSAIGDFAHLNVTVTQVGFHPKGSDEEETESPETEEPTETVESTETESPTAVGSSTESVSVTTTETPDEEAADETDDFGGWVVEPIENRTVDLTTLVGDNATQIAGVELPAGEYNGVFIWVSAVEGTLQDGSTVDVKLPSERLRLNTHFTIEPDAEVDFVFDITVVETGNGRYILQPVISESGTDVPIDRVDDAGGPPMNEADDGGPTDNPGTQSGNAGGQSDDS